jgi:hypothetical protein
MSFPGLASPHTYAPPAVSAFLQRSRCGAYWVWIVRHCEKCGRGHRHGGGTIGDDPRRSLGHRAGHCRVAIPDGYVLTDGDPDCTERILREVR